MTNLLAAVLMVASHERLADAGHLTKYHERFNPGAMTCACWNYPAGTWLKVKEIHNGSSVIVRVIDTPAKRFKGRIDLSPAAFQKLDGLQLGLADVRVEEIKP